MECLPESPDSRLEKDRIRCVIAHESPFKMILRASLTARWMRCFVSNEVVDAIDESRHVGRSARCKIVFQFIANDLKEDR